jgi:hypothetical protein
VETLTVAKEEWDRLVQRDRMLTALEACGVDNWEGHSDAYQMVSEQEKQEEHAGA